MSKGLMLDLGIKAHNPEVRLSNVISAPSASMQLKHLDIVWHGKLRLNLNTKEFKKIYNIDIVQHERKQIPQAIISQVPN